MWGRPRFKHAPYEWGEARSIKASNTFLAIIARMQTLMGFRALSKDLNIYITWSLDHAAADQAQN